MSFAEILTLHAKRYGAKQNLTDKILFFFFFFGYFSGKIWLDLSCESSARQKINLSAMQMIHIKSQASFSL